jgi:hypothetical protein
VPRNHEPRTGYNSGVSDDQNNPPSRDGLGDDEVWEWADDHWEIRRILPFEEPNAGGSPAGVEEP